MYQFIYALYKTIHTCNYDISCYLGRYIGHQVLISVSALLFRRRCWGLIEFHVGVLGYTFISSAIIVVTGTWRHIGYVHLSPRASVFSRPCRQ